MGDYNTTNQEKNTVPEVTVGKDWRSDYIQGRNGRIRIYELHYKK